MMELPQVSSGGGGWLDQKYVTTEIKCSVCGGTGEVNDTYAILKPGALQSDRIDTSAFTLEEQFTAVRRELVSLLRESRHLPRNTVHTWVKSIRETSPENSDSVEMFRDIQAEFEWLKPHCKPLQVGAQLDLARETEYDAEMKQIGSLLHYLVKLVLRMEQLLERTPWRFEAE